MWTKKATEYNPTPHSPRGSSTKSTQSIGNEKPSWNHPNITCCVLCLHITTCHTCWLDYFVRVNMRGFKGCAGSKSNPALSLPEVAWKYFVNRSPLWNCLRPPISNPQMEIWSAGIRVRLSITSTWSKRAVVNNMSHLLLGLPHSVYPERNRRRRHNENPQ